MTTLYTFTALPLSESIYLVSDRLSNRHYIGKVAKVGRYGPWIAAPGDESLNGRRKGFRTRGDAAYALSRFCDTGNSSWIFA